MLNCSTTIPKPKETGHRKRDSHAKGAPHISACHHSALTPISLLLIDKGDSWVLRGLAGVNIIGTLAKTLPFQIIVSRQR